MTHHFHTTLFWSAQALSAHPWASPVHKHTPSAKSRINGLDHYGDCQPACGLSRDYLDYVDLPEGDPVVVVGQIAGPALTPAVFTSFLRAIAATPKYGRERSLADLAAKLHERFYELCPEDSYASMFAARYDYTRGLLHYVNAGHEAPLVLRKAARGYRAAALAPTGPVVGMLRRATFRERAVSLAPGDLLAVYTDGLCETTNTEGEQWGFRRLIESLKAAGSQNARDIVEHVLEAAANFAGGGAQYDDRTLWVCRVADMHNATFTLSDSALLPAVA